ncbi:hypothetical protein [Pseudomonas aeruginosa]|uniref:hypothetical protein n=1 Tax=Pseudomonas aeruginosa TaxID=287 RepID=UPI00255A9F44|nr:hypothetical protein [Pseudomonas aeruginosa]MDL4564930.1 hypothetical protein [Pseudomonas aeruginosa]
MVALYEFAFFVIGAACSYAIFFEAVIMRALFVGPLSSPAFGAVAGDCYWPRGAQKYGSYAEVVEEAREAAIAKSPGYSRVEAVRIVYPANGRQDMATYGLEFYCLSQGVERMCSTSYNNPIYRKGDRVHRA